MKKILPVLLISILYQVSAQQIIFEDGFEDGQLKSEWTSRPSLEGEDGVAQIFSTGELSGVAHSGSAGFALGKSANTNYEYPVQFHAPAYASFAFGIGAPGAVTFPNIHLGALLKWFSGEGLTKPNSTRGFYLGLHVTLGDDDSYFGPRATYLLRPIESRWNYYPLVQFGISPARNDKPQRIELRVGAGVSYSFGRYGILFSELGNGVAPFLLGLAWKGNFYKKVIKKRDDE